MINNDLEITLPDRSRLGVQAAVAILDRYFDPTNGFGAVWEFFDASVTGPKDQIEVLDVLSLTALNAFQVGAMTAITTLWLSKEKADAEAIIATITKDPLEALSAHGRKVAAERLGQAAETLEAVDGWSLTRIGKLLYRLRPNIAPVFDRIVGEWYPNQTTWKGRYPAVIEDIARNAGPLRAAVERSSHANLPIVRAWDILLWQIRQDPDCISRE